ncbi:MAG: lipid-binding SYLF domain-containing protein [Candidatus Sedimenticola endophacoides]
MSGRRLLAGLFVLLADGFVLPAVAGSDQEAKLAEVVEVLRELEAVPEQAIPPALLADARAVVIIPSVIKVGLVVCGRYGKGVMSLRREDGTWGAPLFLSLKGGSVGWQIGAQATDVILVFKTLQSVNGMLEGKFTLGADAAVAAGPIGRQASASTDAQLKAEIYSYSRSRGLFAGISLDGAVLDIEHGDNAACYHHPGIVPEVVLGLAPQAQPEAARRLTTRLRALSGEGER